MKTFTTLLMTSALMLSSTAFAADPSTILAEKVAAALTEQLSLSSAHVQQQIASSLQATVVDLAAKVVATSDKGSQVVVVSDVGSAQADTQPEIFME